MRVHICAMGRLRAGPDRGQERGVLVIGRPVVKARLERGLVDLDEARQRVALGIDHGFAQLGGEQPGAAIRTDPELVLGLQRRDPVRMRRHQVGGPEPDGERELAAVQDGPRRHRGLAMAARALERVGLAA